MTRIITIGREFGSNGRAIAKELAETLDISFYDNELITLAAQKSKVPAEVFAKADEKKSNPLLYSSIEYQVGQGYSSIAPINDVLYQAQSDTIREVADKEDCVIVGRCADFVLENHPRCRHIFIFAPMDVRVATVRRRENLDERGAQAMIKKMDKQRRLYYNYYTDRKWGDLKNYDISLDSSVFERAQIIDLLKVVYAQL
jgi:cytidylate kinase